MNVKPTDFTEQLEAIRAITGCDLVAVALVEPAENQYVLKWKYIAGSINNRIKKVILSSGKGIAGMVFKTGKPMLLPAVSDSMAEHDLFNFPILSLENLKSIGAVPLWHNGRVAGVLLGGFRGDESMTEVQMDVLKKAAAGPIGNLNGKELMLS